MAGQGYDIGASFSGSASSGATNSGTTNNRGGGGVKYQFGGLAGSSNTILIEVIGAVVAVAVVLTFVWLIRKK